MTFFSKVFPATRLECHICSGDLKSNCSGNMNANPLPCRLYAENDQCYIRKTSKSTISTHFEIFKIRSSIFIYFI